MNPKIKHMTGGLAFATVVALVFWIFHQPGMFSIDEAHYTLAAERWLNHASFDLPNGYERFPHELLLPLHPSEGEIAPASGRLTTFIPPLYTFPAALFYALGGETGLFLINTLSFLGVALLTGLLAARLAFALLAKSSFDVAELGPRAFWTGALLVVFSTYLAEYAVAVTNHMSSLLLLLAAVSLHPLWNEARPTPSPDRRILHSALCGLVVGIALGFRLQNVVGVGVLGAGFLLLSRGSLRCLGYYALGLLPPVLVISIVNGVRFGLPHPFTYGMAAQRDLVPLLSPILRSPALLAAAAVAGLGVLLLIALLGTQRWRTLPAERRERLLNIALPALLALFVAVGLFLPVFSGNFAERILGVTLLGPESPQWLRLGAFDFWIGIINALAQSYPLALLVLAAPFLPGLVPGRHEGARPDFRPLVLLGLLAWGNVFLVCLLRNTGGYMPNQRYLLEVTVLGSILLPSLALPFLRSLPRPALLAGGGIALLHAAAVGLIMVQPGRDWSFLGKLPDEPPLPGGLIVAFVMADRVVPILYGALALLGFVLAASGSPGPPAEPGPAPESPPEEGTRRLGLLLFAIALVPCVVVPLFNHAVYDFRSVRRFRELTQTAHEKLASLVPDGSVLVVPQVTRAAAVRLKTSRDVWVAHASRTEWEGVPELLEEIARAGAREHYFIVSFGAPSETIRALSDSFDIGRAPGDIPVLVLRPRSSPVSPEDPPDQGEER